MAAVLNADTDELRAAASRWQMIGGDLGASGGIPSVNLAKTWPSAAATSGEICPETVGCTPACWRGPTEVGGRDFGFNSGS